MRRGVGEYYRGPYHHVLPPINGGLHCGHDARIQQLLNKLWVLPPINGGLHCGR